MRHGIDLKTHSQCQRRRPKSPTGRSRISFRFILECLRRPPSFAKASEDILRSSLRERSRMVEPVGIEPTTSSLQS